MNATILSPDFDWMTSEVHPGLSFTEPHMMQRLRHLHDRLRAADSAVECSVRYQGYCCISNTLVTDLIETLAEILTGQIPSSGEPSKISSPLAKIASMPDPGSAVVSVYNSPSSQQFAATEESHGELIDDPLCQEPLRINNYIIIKRVATGTQGRVYRATSDEDADLGKAYAIKIVPMSSAQQRKASNIIAPPEELVLWKRLHHQNVCPLIEAIHDRDNHCVCLVTPLYEHGLLSVREDGTATKLELEQLMPYFLGIVRGMKYLHAKNIAHWDLKPDNVLFDPETRQAKLIDFGVSEDMHSTAKSGRTPWMRGTPLFWPPEMFDEESTVIDGRAADVWAFGVMMYSAATGRLPFFALSITELGKLVRTTDAKIPADLPLPLQSLLMWVLSRKPESRPSFADIRAHEFFCEELAASPFLPPAPPNRSTMTRAYCRISVSRESIQELARAKQAAPSW